MAKKPNILDQIIERFADETFLKADGFDDAVIGVDYQSRRLIYSMSKSLSVLIKGGMGELDAMEYFDFNVAGSYMGEQTPIWMDDLQ